MIVLACHELHELSEGRTIESYMGQLGNILIGSVAKKPIMTNIVVLGMNNRYFVARMV